VAALARPAPRPPRDEAAVISGGHLERDQLAARWRQQWQAELARYDADPLSWSRVYWRTYLRRIVEEGHHRAPGRLAAQLIGHGLILEQDAVEVLGSAWPPST
jgi:hypothetical protein